MTHKDWYQQRYSSFDRRAASQAKADQYAALNEAKKQKKLGNTINAQMVFAEHTIQYEIKGNAWLCTVSDHKYYFYPTTNKWRPQGGKTTYCSRGAADFIGKVLSYQAEKD